MKDKAAVESRWELYESGAELCLSVLGDAASLEAISERADLTSVGANLRRRIAFQSLHGTLVQWKRTAFSSALRNWRHNMSVHTAEKALRQLARVEATVDAKLVGTQNLLNLN